MELERCERCAGVLCEGDCVALVDGIRNTLRDLVRDWGIQARQVKEHLAKGTHPRCADGQTVIRTSDGKKLRPCDQPGGLKVLVIHKGKRSYHRGLVAAAKALGTTKSRLHELIHDPGRPAPKGWKCEALASELGWHYRRPL